MATQDTDVKRAAETKLWLEGRISQLQEEVERLKEALEYVDANLRAETFKPAIEMMAAAAPAPEVRELKRDKGGQVIATASITSDSVTVEPKEGIELKQATSPFRSFLMGKILQGMKEKDDELAKAGKIQKADVIRFDVEEDGGTITKVVVENYRDKARLNEILNTVSWTFSRMLEKQ